MSSLPCKKCPSCNRYHDLSVMTCDACAADLSNLPALLTETADIPAEQRGTIDESVAVFVQKCWRCGATNFTADPASRVKTCHNCYKSVAGIEPIPYANPSQKPAAEAAKTDKTAARTDGSAGKARIALPDEEDDDGQVMHWPDYLEECQKASDSVQSKPSITLTAINYGQLSFTVEAKDGENYMLGRDAHHKEFLEQDVYVGNEHCYLYFENGVWHVQDNHSANGTFVNQRDLGFNGHTELHDGDTLRLGHHADSIAFRISIG